MTWAQSMLAPAGAEASAIAHLWWVFVWACTAVYVLVLIAAAAAVLHRRRGDPNDQAGGRAAMGVVVAAVGVSVVILFTLLTSSIVTGRQLQPRNDARVNITLTGQQWWWAVEYPSDVPSQIVRTANEIHIPVGSPVLITLRSVDVIHSFWVPNLHGKKDLIPGHETTITVRADREGIYRGQCAEFCGHQHAHMALLVVAESPQQFTAWLEAQRKPSVEPRSPAEQRGQQVFLQGPCIMCHTIRGTDAGGRVAPDLTHLASRRSIAAGTLPNTPGHLAGWISDAQRIKPGTRMPTMAIAAEDLQSLVQYLQTLD
jgi:cytochrome c oxidase subunit II